MKLKNNNDNKNNKMIILIAAIAVIAILAGVLVGIGLTSFLNNTENEIADAVAQNPVESTEPVVVEEDENSENENSQDSEASNSKDEDSDSDEGEEDSDDKDDSEQTEVSTKPTAASSDSGKPLSEVKALIQPKEIPVETEEAVVSPLSADEKYIIITDDVSALDAMKDCHERGGHLLYIDDYDEYAQVVKFIYDNKADNCIFYLGGYREEESKDYYWVNYDRDKVSKSPLNGSKSWCVGAWAEYEPAIDNDDCRYMSMYYNSGEGRWVWMSIGNDLPGIAPQYLGRTAYICEFE